MGLKMGRYAGLTALLAVFLLGAGALLAINALFANRAADSLAAVRAISAQQQLPQVIASDTQMVKNDLSARRYLGRGLNELKKSVKDFDAALTALDAQVSAAAADSSPFAFAPLGAIPTQRKLQELRQLWGEYHQALKPVAAFDGNPYVETADQGTQLSTTGLQLNRDLDEAIRIGLTGRAMMATQIGELSVQIEQATRARAVELRTWLIAGGAAACVLLLVIGFYVSRVLSRHEQSITRAKKETDDILRTVNQGLFLLDKDLNIGSERSEALERIFHREDFQGLSFDALLRGIVPEKTLETAREYVKLMWGERVNEKLIKTINPLGEVEVNIDTGGVVETQFLEFDFNRVRADGRMSRLLVTVNDVTRRVQLAHELQESQEKAQAQLDLLLHILHVEPRQLTAFLEESEVAMKMVNSIFKEPAREETAFRAKLDGIFRQIHSVKGEAAALGLKTVESRAHGFEELLAEMRSRPTLSGNDFLPLVVKLDDLFGHLAQVREMVGRLADLRVAMSGEGEPALAKPAAAASADTGPEGTMIQPAPELLARLAEGAEAAGLETTLTSLAERMAGEHLKHVRVTFNGFEALPADYRRAIKDISIQMVRNCVTHGIESPTERVAANKTPTGTILFRFENRGAEGYELVVQDDGRGLSAEQLKETAVKRGLITRDQASALDERRALSLIFLAGFTTQEKVTKDAGRGVGMDIVRNLIQQLGGKVGVSTTVGKFARFRIWLPAKPKAQVAA